MAEGILRNAAGDLMEVFSAGSKPTGSVHPLAVHVMKEIGIDLEGHTSKSLEPFLNAGISTVITVCGNADDACPAFPGKVDRFHWDFEDPPHARREGESELDTFRRIRDEIQRVFTAYASGYRQARNSESPTPASQPPA